MHITSNTESVDGWRQGPRDLLTSSFHFIIRQPLSLPFKWTGATGLPGRIHDTIIERAGRLISEPPYYKPGGLYKPATTSLPTRKGRNKRSAKELNDSADEYQRSLDKKNLDKLILKHVENAFNDTKQPSEIAGAFSADPSLSKRQEAYRELIAARDDNPVFSIVDRDRLIDAVNRLPTLNPYVALQVHGAMTGVIWLGRLEEEF